MKGSKTFLGIKHLLCAGVILLGLSMGSCSNDNLQVKPPKPEENIPTTIAECVSADIVTLRAIAQANPQANLFEGDKPKEWKGVELEWVKNKDGKYSVSVFRIKEETKLTDFVLRLEGKGEADVLAHLKTIDIVSAALKEVKISAQPDLKKVRINGIGKSKVESLDIQGGKALKNVSIEAMPALTAIMLGGDEMESVTLDNLPAFKEQSNLKFRIKNEEEKTEDTVLKSLILKGDLKMLDGLYLSGLGLEELIIEASLPAMTSLSLNRNKLKGTFELKGLEKLQTLYLGNNNISTLKVSACPELTELDASGNATLTVADLNLPGLKTLDLNETGLTALDMSSFASIKKVSAYSSKLVSVTLSAQNSKLSQLNLSENHIEKIDFPQEVKSIFLLTLNKNELKSLDLTHMTSLERALLNDNKLESLVVSPNEKDVESFEHLECKNNHLSAKILRGIPQTLTELSKMEAAPQSLLGRVDVEKKQINAVEERDELMLSVIIQKHDGKDWVDAPAEDFSEKGGIYTFSDTGKYRAICADIGLYWKFDTFGKKNPYIIGEVGL
ncbi:leucine-rich repeat domain-containing protein [Porphyromonas cangingivalis]|uniref:leucine-rich repeat domain-containing protein n=1 Tax=Porphyromonas cangingivalis TaxID=36874 RepID=UPI000B1DAB7F|nr:leucine-rich repeat domain-containing protein [Porphyromonas cangingivalis]